MDNGGSWMDMISKLVQMEHGSPYKISDIKKIELKLKDLLSNMEMKSKLVIQF
jgi:uncharacterized protein YdcH (DUF465 family)